MLHHCPLFLNPDSQIKTRAPQNLSACTAYLDFSSGNGSGMTGSLAHRFLNPIPTNQRSFFHLDGTLEVTSVRTSLYKQDKAEQHMLMLHIAIQELWAPFSSAPDTWTGNTAEDASCNATAAPREQ